MYSLHVITPSLLPLHYSLHFFLLTQYYFILGFGLRKVLFHNSLRIIPLLYVKRRSQNNYFILEQKGIFLF